MIFDWHRFAVSPTTALLQTLSTIDEGGQQMALVVDEGKLVGLVTDGDVRRALVRGISTSSSIAEVMNPAPTVGTVSEGPAGWRMKLRRQRIRHLPIVDESGLLQQIVTEQSGDGPRDSWVVIMAGGLGTRLRPITENIPKPMIEVGGRPILETIIDTLAHFGFRKVFLSVNYRAEMIEAHFRDGAEFGVEIQYLREPMRLGTAGALAMLPPGAQAPILVMNGDILTGLDLGAFVDAHVGQSAALTVGAREYVTQVPYGVMQLDGNRLLGIEEKPSICSVVSAGIYVLSPSILSLVPKGAFFDMPTLVSSAIANQEKVLSHVVREYWIDVGRMDDLERARNELGRGVSA